MEIFLPQEEEGTINSRIVTAETNPALSLVLENRNLLEKGEKWMKQWEVLDHSPMYELEHA